MKAQVNKGDKNKITQRNLRLNNVIEMKHTYCLQQILNVLNGKRYMIIQTCIRGNKRQVIIKKERNNII